MMTPTITVLMTCYNAAEFLPEAIESILSQTYSDFEFILIDDGSLDSTLSIIKHYAATDRRIVPIAKQNTGMTDSLNLGIRLAKGEWIVRLDADDVAMPERIEWQMRHIQMHSDLVLLGTGCIEIDHTGKEIKRHHYPATNAALVHSLENGGTPFPHSSAIYRTKSVQDLGGYRNRLMGAGDLDLWLRMSRVGPIECLAEPLIKLRRHSSSMSSDVTGIAILGHMARVSYHLTQSRHLDPVEQSEAKFTAFKTWLGRRLMEEHILEAGRVWSNLRNDWYMCRAENLPVARMKLIVGFLVSRHALQVLKIRFGRKNWSQQFATEWVQLKHDQNTVP